MTYTIIETSPSGKVNVIAAYVKTLKAAVKIAHTGTWAVTIIDDRSGQEIKG